MSYEFDEIENEWKALPKCEVCGGYGYHYPYGSHSAARCPSCKGSKISQKPGK